MTQTIAYYIAMLGRKFNRYCGLKLQEIGLTRGLLYFILYIGNHPDCSPGELGQALHMDGGHVARSLVKLDEGGFIRREQNPRDKRAHILTLTAKGAAAFQISHDLFHQWDQEILREMKPADKQLLFSLLEQTAREMREAGNV